MCYYEPYSRCSFNQAQNLLHCVAHTHTHAYTHIHTHTHTQTHTHTRAHTPTRTHTHKHTHTNTHIHTHTRTHTHTLTHTHVQFLSDVALVWHNCFLYNEEGDLVYESGRVRPCDFFKASTQSCARAHTHTHTHTHIHTHIHTPCILRLVQTHIS